MKIECTAAEKLSLLKAIKASNRCPVQLIERHKCPKPYCCEICLTKKIKWTVI